MIVLALYVCMILKAGQKKVARGYTGFDLSLFLPKQWDSTQEVW